MSGVHLFEGSCQVCGGRIAYLRGPGSAVEVEVGEDGRSFARIRHFATAPDGADPECAVVASIVRDVHVATFLVDSEYDVTGYRSSSDVRNVEDFWCWLNTWGDLHLHGSLSPAEREAYRQAISDAMATLGRAGVDREQVSHQTWKRWIRR